MVHQTSTLVGSSLFLYTRTASPVAANWQPSSRISRRSLARRLAHSSWSAPPSILMLVMSVLQVHGDDVLCGVLIIGVVNQIDTYGLSVEANIRRQLVAIRAQKGD